MKKSIYFLVLLSVCIAGCAIGKHKNAEISEPGAASVDTSMSTSEASQPANETAEQGSAVSSSESAAETHAVTAASMTKKDVQAALQKAGFYKGTVDGKYGPKTRAAIKEFQKANGLVADGLVGKKTKVALVKYLN